VLDVSSDDSEGVGDGAGSDKSVLVDCVRLTDGDLRPGAVGGGIDIDDLLGSDDLIEPGFDLACFFWVLFAGSLYSCLDFSDGQGADE